MRPNLNSGSLSKSLLSLTTAIVFVIAHQRVHSAPPTLESVLRDDPAFSLFTKAMDIIHFWEHLEQERDSITLFVPTNETLITEGSDFLVRSVLMTEENRERLKHLVSLHATNAPILSGGTPDSRFIRTLSEDCLEVTHIGNAIKVGPEAYVVSARNIGKNQLFVIDRLLIPPHQPDVTCDGNNSTEIGQ